ncbi:porin [Rhodobacteraceae bacterium RKSG542]|uniref:porin n=1 Tax=Pseudovibrio flavus TaxID=2529854 RepID=UPI0012BD5448|nr:porin [Pseudovibrio flavus]MTI18617.1 porin [Pseudovibrio flavus]
MRKLIQGAAALLMGASPVYAADLPVAPEPVEYVQICDAYGRGYFFIPGTDTCLRIRGRVRAEYRFRNFGSEPNGWTDRDLNGTETRGRAYLRMDARTQTEYGLLRAYIDVYWTSDTQPAGSILSSAVGTTLDGAFIQFGGLTVGRTQSFFDFWTGYAYGSINTVAYSDRKTWVAGYTADFGNGFSSSLAIEDRSFRNENLFAGTYLNSTGFAQGYGGTRWPSLVLNFRVDQGWGSAQIMGAISEVRYLDSLGSGDVGWAIGAGVEVNLGWLGDSQFALQGDYGQGAIDYVNSSWDQRAIAIGTTNFRIPTDASTTTGTVKRGDGMTEAWSIEGGIYTEWTPEWNTAFQASYAQADFDRLPDIDQFDVIGKIGWTPVDGFEIGTEIEYRYIDYTDIKTRDTRLTERDEVIVVIRAQRDF